MHSVFLDCFVFNIICFEIQYTICYGYEPQIRVDLATSGYNKTFLYGHLKSLITQM